MKGIVTLALIFVAFSPILFAQTPDAWVQKTDYPDSASISTVAFSIGNLAYFGTGFNVITCTNDFWAYDAAGDTWTSIAPVPGGNRTGAIAFSLNGKGYVGLGADCSFDDRNDLWEYDPGSNTWTQKANFGGAARRWAVAFTVGNKAYITGGYDGSLYSDLWCYNPADDTWTQKADFIGVPRANAVAFSIGGKGYVGTGYNDTTNLLDFWAYDTLANAWSPIANYQGTSVAGAMAFSISNKGYVGGGSTIAGSNKHDFYSYDPSANTWAQISNIPSARTYGSACAVNNAGYVLSGQDSTSAYTKSLWQYTPAITGITEASSNYWMVSISPNPFRDVIVLKNLPAFNNTEISIYNLLGEKILSQRSEAESVTLDLNSFLSANGIYFVSFTSSGKGSVNYKLVKE